MPEGYSVKDNTGTKAHFPHSHLNLLPLKGVANAMTWMHGVYLGDDSRKPRVRARWDEKDC